MSRQMNSFQCSRPTAIFPAKSIGKRCFYTVIYYYSACIIEEVRSTFLIWEVLIISFDEANKVKGGYKSEDY